MFERDVVEALTSAVRYLRLSHSLAPPGQRGPSPGSSMVSSIVCCSYTSGAFELRAFTTLSQPGWDHSALLRGLEAKLRYFIFK